MLDPYSSAKLESELKAVGLDIDGCNSKGVVWMRGGRAATPQELALIEQVKASHDPLAKTAQELQIESLRAKIKNRTASVADLMQYIAIKEGL